MQICKVWEWSNENCEVYQLSQFFLVEMKSEPTDTGLNCQSSWFGSSLHTTSTVITHGFDMNISESDDWLTHLMIDWQTYCL